MLTDGIRTQLEAAKKGYITKEMEEVAHREGIPVETLLEYIKEGKTIIVKNNRKRDVVPLGIGYGMLTKINANIGVSPDASSLEEELEKLDIAIKYGANAVMDLSVGKDIRAIRKEIIEHSSVPVGTVPIYELADRVLRRGERVEDMTIKEFLEIIEEQARSGVDFMTIHAGTTRRGVELTKTRLMGIVSRGGSLIEEWMLKNNKENFLYEHFDEILDILYEYDVTISLGDGLRPGATYDANDPAQIEEMTVLGELTLRARERNVQVMIEGPGHMPIDTIEANIRLEKTLCYNAPYYVLGPLVTDIAPGYDHITSAIGGALAASYGADFLCYVTPAEHLSLPNKDDVREGVIAAKIAAHAGDMVKYPERVRKWDDEMSRYRKALNWDMMFKLAIDPDRAKEKRGETPPQEFDLCSMCGEFCAVRRDTVSKKEKVEWYL